MLEGQNAELENHAVGLPPIKNFSGGNDITLSLSGHLFV